MLLQYNCKHASVGPSPTPPVVNDPTKLSCILSARNWQFLAIVGRTDFFLVLAALQPPICCSNTTANTFQWVRPRPRRSSMIIQTVRAFFRQKIGNFWPLLGELIFFCAGGLATPDMLLQYSCKHVSVGPSPTPAVLNDPTNRSCILSAKSWQFMAIFGRKLIFFFALAALQPPICCSNTTANTFQWVRPRPRRSSMILQNSRAFFRQNIGNFWPLLGELIFFLCWRPCNPRYVAPIQLQTRFSGSVPDPAGRQ